jgi:tetratricopeptide (TPR) repeat protein
MDIKNIHKQAYCGIRYDLLICFFLVATTAAVYWQVRNFEFVSFDDHLYVTANPHVQAGLSIENLIWSFTDGTQATNYWAPLTWLSIMLDYQLFGMNPGGYHVTNLLLHIANALLLFFILNRMTGAIWRSAFVSALFALHPLHVESVAWVAERKDVLYTFFWMLSIWSYAYYVDRPGIKRYLLVLLFFSLGLMAKPMMITLPFVLLLLDYWPLGRFQSGPGARKSSISQRLPGLRLVWEKVPFSPIIVISSIATYITQQKGGAIVSLEVISIPVRIGNAIVSYAGYIQKLIWPHSLAFLYPHPGALPWWKILGAFGFLACVSLFAISTRRRYPWFAVGWLWYLVTLVPVIGLVVIGPFAMADRYTYVSLIGLFILITWGVTELVGRMRYGKIGLALTSAVLLPILMAITWVQTGYWQNSGILYEHAIDVTVGNYVAHNNLGIALAEKGRPHDAILNYSKALQIEPDFIEAHNNLGVVLVKQGRITEAIEHYTYILRIKPNLAGTHNNLGKALEAQGRLSEAIPHYLEALRIDPNDTDVSINLGLALEAQGKIDEAIRQYREALRFAPCHAGIHNNLGAALLRKGTIAEAIRYFLSALNLDPGQVDAHNNLGVALAGQGKTDEAVYHFQNALRIKPGHIAARNNLNKILGILE